MPLIISRRIRTKLSGKAPPVTEDEIIQCFANRIGVYLEDDREQHRSNPPTQWFIAQTDYGRNLKVVFIQEDTDIYIRTAYVPNDEELRIYEKYGIP